MITPPTTITTTITTITISSPTFPITVAPGVRAESPTVIYFTDEAAVTSSAVDINGSLLNSTIPTDLSRNEGLAVIEVAISATILFLAITGNSMVVALLLLKRGKLSRMHLMMMHLSLADLSVAFFQVLPQMIWDITYRFRGGAFLCGAVKYLQLVTMYGSSYVLLSMALDRYMAICRPFLTHSWTSRHAHLLVLAAWCAALLFSLPQLFIFSWTDLGDGVYDCWATFEPPWTLTFYVTWNVLSVFVAPALTLAALYGRISFAVWKSSTLEENMAPRYIPQWSPPVAETERHPTSLSPPSGADQRPFQNSPAPFPSHASPVSPFHAASWKQSRADLDPPSSATHLLLGELPTSTSAPMSTNSQSPAATATSYQNPTAGALPPMSNQSVNIVVNQTDIYNGNPNHNDPQPDANRQSLNPSHGNIAQGTKQNSLTSSHGDLSQETNKQSSSHVGLLPQDPQRSSFAPSNTSSSNVPTGQRPYRNGNSNRPPNSTLDNNVGSKAPAPPPSAAATAAAAARFVAGRSSPPRGPAGPAAGGGHGRGGRGTEGISRAKVKTIKLTLTVVLVYMICWTPFYVAQLWAVYDENVPYENIFFTLVLLLASVNSCTNPWIYMAFSDTVWNSLRARVRALACCFRFRPRSSSDQSPRSTLTSVTTAHHGATCLRTVAVNGADSML